jgi:hypothetical protein
MTVPAYLTALRQVKQKPERYEINEIDEKRSDLNSLNSFISSPPAAEPFPFARTLDALERRCPDHIEPERCRLCIHDAKHFLAAWGDHAEALGWTAAELFGLHAPAARPHPTYNRLSRYDATGLIWNLIGRRVVALTGDTAAIKNRTTGNTLIYRKHNKPGLGPVGDSLDDFT